MRNLLFILILNPFVWGCTLYRSAGRNQFESASTTSISTANYQLKECRQLGNLEAWLYEEFPLRDYELILTENNLEIWKSPHAENIEITTFENEGPVTHACIYSFENEDTWNFFKESFIDKKRTHVADLKE